MINLHADPEDVWERDEDGAGALPNPEAELFLFAESRTIFVFWWKVCFWIDQEEEIKKKTDSQDADLNTHISVAQ